MKAEDRKGKQFEPYTPTEEDYEETLNQTF